jgi:hypothetical protein
VKKSTDRSLGAPSRFLTRMRPTFWDGSKFPPGANSQVSCVASAQVSEDELTHTKYSPQKSSKRRASLLTTQSSLRKKITISSLPGQPLASRAVRTEPKVPHWQSKPLRLAVTLLLQISSEPRTPLWRGSKITTPG